MQTIVLQISQDEKANFFSLYDQLGPCQKKIWRRMVWYARRYPSAYPTQAKISKGIPCSRKHVNQTISLFKRYGWVNLISRGRGRAKAIFIPHHLMMIDVYKREYLKKLEVTSKVTHSSYIDMKLTSQRAGEIRKGSFKKLDPDPFGIKCGFSINGCLKMSLVSEATREEAKEVARKLGRQGWKPDNQETYFLGILFKIAKKKGERIDWPNYYQTIAVR